MYALDVWMLFWTILSCQISGTFSVEIDSMIFSTYQNGTQYPAAIKSIPADLDVLLANRETSYTSSRIHFSNPSVRVTCIICDQGNNTVFFSEGTTNTIYRWDYFNSWLNDTKATFVPLHKGVSSDQTQVTYDWINQNVYWTDAEYRWIAIQPAFTTDPYMYKPIVYGNLTRPLAITVVPTKRYLFWSDIGSTPTIERSLLSGENRTVIVRKGPTLPNTMTSDVASAAIYWTDTSRDTIETCSYDGQNHRVIARINLADLTSIALYQDIVCAVAHDDEIIYCYRTSTGERTISFIVKSGYIRAMALYDSSKHSVAASPCKVKGCSHMCVTDLSGIAKCICRHGFTLQTDGTTCKAETEYYGIGILLSNSTTICIYEIRILTGFQHEVVCFMRTAGTITNIEVDWEDSYVFYTESVNKTINIYNRVTNTTSILTSTGDVTGLTYDWIDKNIYWIESGIGRIHVASVSTRSTSYTYTNIDTPKDITVDPHDRKLFWTVDGSLGDEIRMGWTNGSGSEMVLKGVTVGNSSGLYFDTGTNRLYWISAGQVRSAATDGSDIKTHGYVGTTTSNYIVYKNYLVFVTSALYLKRALLSTFATDTVQSVVKMGTVTGMAVLDPALQRQEKGACEVMNGGCEEICISTDVGRTCDCSLGYELQDDEKSCSSVPFDESFILAADTTHHKIYQVNLKDAQIKALDIHVASIVKPFYVSYDYKTKTVLWSDGYGNIQSSTLTGVNVTTIYSSAYFVDGLAIDFSSGNIYFAEVSYRLNTGYIRVKRKGVSPLIVVDNLNIPRAVAVYPSKGYLFWTDYGYDHIKRAYMDGTSATTIISYAPFSPYGITIDYISDQLYWTDGHSQRIETSDLNGYGRKTLVTDSGRWPMHIVQHGPYVYYTHWNKQKITKVDKTTGFIETWMSDNVEFGRLGGLALWTGKDQPISTYCSTGNGGCSTYCLPIASGRRCGCEDGVNLQVDGKTCEGVLQCPISIQGGIVESTCSRYEGHTCSYSCSFGYKKNTDISEITCNRYGDWAEKDKTLCKPIKCELGIENGKFSGCSGSYNEYCRYSCNTGFTMNELFATVRCTSSGIWSVSTGQLCKRVQCKDEVLHGGLDKACSAFYEDTCDYECESGYKKNENIPAISCLATGNWNASVNSLCREIQCSSTIENGNLTGCSSFTIGSVCSYECDSGFKKKEAVSVLYCLSSGKWQETNPCVPNTCSTSLQNGRFTGCMGLIGTPCSFECEAGYASQINVQSVTCLSSGQWNVPVGQLCKAIVISCNNTIPNGQFDILCNFVAGSSCEYTCNPGFHRNKGSAITCQQNGQWDTQRENLCIASTCTEILQNIDIDSACDRRPTSKCKFTCKPGFKAKSSTAEITCSRELTWEGTLSNLCEEIRCSDKIDHGSILAPCGFKIGNQCGFKCDVNYVPFMDRKQLSCDATGLWIGEKDTFCTLEKSVSPEQVSSNASVVGGASAAGVLVAILLVVLLIIVVCRRRRQMRKNENYSDMRTIVEPGERDVENIVNPAYDDQCFGTDPGIKPRPLSDLYAEIQDVGSIGNPNYDAYEKPKPSKLDLSDVERKTTSNVNDKARPSNLYELATANISSSNDYIDGNRLSEFWGQQPQNSFSENGVGLGNGMEQWGVVTELANPYSNTTLEESDNFKNDGKSEPDYLVPGKKLFQTESSGSNVTETLPTLPTVPPRPSQKPPVMPKPSTDSTVDIAAAIGLKVVLPEETIDRGSHVYQKLEKVHTQAKESSE